MSGSLNKVMLIGNLGDDIKMHNFEDGGCIGRFPIATNEIKSVIKFSCIRYAWKQRIAIFGNVHCAGLPITKCVTQLRYAR